MILVIADDFSGAAEIAGVANQFGLTAQVQCDSLGQSDSDVVVVDTDTRSLPEPQAARVLRDLAPSIRNSRPKWWFKKIDSVLRGPVLAEIDALRESLSLNHALLINANPRKHRTVREGQLLISEEFFHTTVLARDPEYPRTDSTVASMLGANTDQIKIINSADELSCLSASSHIHIANIATSSELKPYAVMKDKPLLLAGAAEFFEALMESESGRFANPNYQPLSLQPNTLIVRGTSIRDQQKENQIEMGEAGTIDLFVCSDRGAETWIDAVCARLRESGIAAIGSNATGASADGTVSESLAASGQLHQRLIEAVVTIFARCRPQHIWIEGGRTASGLVRALGWHQLNVHEVYGDGVVGLRIPDECGVSLVVKPGSYRWPLASGSSVS